MKIMKKILLTGLITTMIPICVNADTFTDGDKIYDFTEREIKCEIDSKSINVFDDLMYENTLKDGTLIFLNNNNQNLEEMFYKVGNDNTCVNIKDTDEILSLIHELYNDLYYFIDFSSGNTATIYRQIFHSIYVDVYEEATTYDQGDYYYTFDGSDYVEAGQIDESTFNQGQYYVYVTYKPSVSSEIDTTKYQYYTTNDRKNFTIVTNPIKENIFSYYVRSETNQTEIKEMKKLSQKAYEVFSELSNQYYIETITSKTEKEYYVIVHDNVNSYSVYDEEGNVLFKDVDEFTTILDTLYAVTKDETLYIYDKNFEVLYTSKEDLYLTELGFLNNISSLGGENKKLYQLKQSNKEEVTNIPSVDSIPNPDTSDDIVSTVIIAIITLLGLVIVVRKLKKIENN